jgi:hypothetical protein
MSSRKNRNSPPRGENMGMCPCGKRRMSKRAAVRVARRMTESSGDRMCPYHCHEGQSWHVGGAQKIGKS